MRMTHMDIYNGQVSHCKKKKNTHQVYLSRTAVFKGAKDIHMNPGHTHIADSFWVCEYTV